MSKQINFPNPSHQSRIHTVSIERRRADFLVILTLAHEIDTLEKFRDWIQVPLQYIFPHERMICGIGKLVDDGAEIEHVITSNVPNEYLQTLHQIGGMRMSPVFNEWVKTRNPVLFDSTEDCNSSEWLENFNRHEMQNMVAHGQCDISSNSVSYFSFSRIPGSLNLHHVNVIKMLVPYLHVVLIRIFMDKNKSDINLQLPLQKKLLTARQVEVLKLFATGLSYKQISESLQIKSHKTVEKHIDSARNKLSVKTRRSCIQKAIELGLI